MTLPTDAATITWRKFLGIWGPAISRSSMLQSMSLLAFGWCTCRRSLRDRRATRPSLFVIATVDHSATETGGHHRRPRIGARLLLVNAAPGRRLTILRPRPNSVFAA